MRKFLLILLCFLVSNIFNPVFGAWQGEGTETEPYLLQSRADVEALADSVNNGIHWSRGKHFKLTQDITDSVRTIIGTTIQITHTEFDNIKVFQGILDGNNHKITLAINNTNINDGFSGLFNQLYEAEVRNLTIDGYVRKLLFYDLEMRSWGGGLVGLNQKSNISLYLNSQNIFIN